MDKTINIGGKNVTFRKTGGTALRYKRQFGRELNADLNKILTLFPSLKAMTESGTEKSAAANLLLSAETEWMYDIAFIMAQQADQTITDEIDWLDSFDDFNVWEIFFQLMPLINAEQAVSPKNA